MQAAEAERYARWEEARRGEEQRLLDALPEWRDNKRAQAEQGELSAWLVDQGYRPEEVGQILDHRAVLIARKAMLFDRQAKAKAKATTPTPPRPVRPNPAQDNTQRRDPALWNRFKKSGSTEDALAILNSLD